MILREKLTQHLYDEATNPDGWLSDLQEGVSVEEQGVYLDGDGYIDINHLVSEVLMILEEEET